MPLSTKSKIALARKVQQVAMIARRSVGLGPLSVCRRGGLRWELDLREGIDFSIYLFGSFEPRTVAAYRTIVSAGAMVIDIGANIGAHALPLGACVGPTGRVIAVEPTEYAFERLRRQISLNPELNSRITPVQVMLMGETDAVLADAIESSWPLATPDDAHPQHAGVAKATTGAIATTLDALVSELSLPNVDFIKLDVDGYEIEVLRGARKTLSKFLPTLVFEHAPYTMVEKGYDPEEMAHILQSLGYVFADLGRHLLGGDGRTLPAIPAGTGVNLLAIPPTGVDA